LGAISITIKWKRYNLPSGMDVPRIHTIAVHFPLVSPHMRED
jgi:hypothetical protein